MIHTWSGAGINDVYPALVNGVLMGGKVVEQRGLRTRELSPVVFQLEHPERRLVTSWGRPVNVTFALAEVLWILTGRRDVAMLEHYNSRISDFSDDGDTFNAAYGYRLRHQHGFDQLDDCIATLEADSGSRQAVLAIWAPPLDRGWERTFGGAVARVTKDRACNLVSHMLLRDGALNWTQVMRSNDAVWGLPYNVVQWTSVQEYVAARLGVRVGTYTHLSDSFHIYDPPLDGGELPSVFAFDLYRELAADHAPMGAASGPNELLQAASAEAVIRSLPWATPVELGAHLPFWEAMLDLFAAHRAYRQHEDVMAYNLLDECRDRVYAVAQLRFYCHHRWNRQPDIVAMVRDDYPPQLAEWICAEA